MVVVLCRVNHVHLNCTVVLNWHKTTGFSGRNEDDQGRKGICFRCGEEGHWARQCRGNYITVVCMYVSYVRHNCPIFTSVICFATVNIHR